MNFTRITQSIYGGMIDTYPIKPYLLAEIILPLLGIAIGQKLSNLRSTRKNKTNNGLSTLVQVNLFLQTKEPQRTNSNLVR